MYKDLPIQYEIYDQFSAKKALEMESVQSLHDIYLVMKDILNYDSFYFVLKHRKDSCNVRLHSVDKNIVIQILKDIDVFLERFFNDFQGEFLLNNIEKYRFIIE